LHPEDLVKTGFAQDTLDQLWSIIEQIDEALKKVKILDPAVWSGAFPMWLLHEITSIRYYSYGIFHKKFATLINEYKDETGKISLYKIKRDVILNNIYGVDIDAGAIEIARLRFWLALVVDEDQPEPLPNFEFKFVCANTLIPLDKDTWTQKIAFDQEIDFWSLQSQMKKYFNCETNKQKQEAKNKIETILSSTSQAFDFGTKSLRTQQLETYKPFDPRHSAEFFDPSLMMWNEFFDVVIG
jgi:adenine-specific DNA-methyltransferase